MLQLLHDQDAGPFSGDEAVAVLVEGPRRPFRSVVPPAHGVHRRERADRKRQDGRLRTAGHHDVGLAATDELGALADRVRARRAGGDVRQARAAKVELHRDLRGAGVRHEHGHQERREPRRTALFHQQNLVDEGLDPAHAGRDRDPDAVAVGSATFQAGIVQRLRRGGDRVLRETVGTPHVLAVEVFPWLEPLHLARDLRLIGRRIETADPGDTAAAVDERVPRARDVEPDGRHRAEPGDDDAPRHGRAPAARSLSAPSAPEIESGSDTFSSLTSAIRFTSPLTT